MTTMHRDAFEVDHMEVRLKIIVVIPAYNEEKNIAKTIKNIQRIADMIIVVDDGSKDATAEIAEREGAIVVQHRVNRGKGQALTTGFKKASELHPDVVVTLDADGQHIPVQMLNVMAPILERRADMVVGSRYLDDTSDVPMHRVWAHWGFNLITSQTSGVSLTDSQSGFRAFSARALEFLSFKSNGFSVECEMQFIANDHNLRTEEVPITILYTDAPKRPAFQHGLEVLQGLLRLVGQYRPLYYFGAPGAFSIALSILILVLQPTLLATSHTLAMAMAFVSALLLIGGTLSSFTGVVLHSLRAMRLGLQKGEATKKLDKALYFVGQERPFLSFGLPGSIFLVLGVLSTAWVSNIYYTTQELAVGYSLGVVMFYFIGSLLLFTGVILHSMRAVIMKPGDVETNIMCIRTSQDIDALDRFSKEELLEEVDEEATLTITPSSPAKHSAPTTSRQFVALYANGTTDTLSSSSAAKREKM